MLKKHHIATCKWFCPLVLVLKKHPCFKWLQNGDLLRSPVHVRTNSHAPDFTPAFLTAGHLSNTSTLGLRENSEQSFWLHKDSHLSILWTPLFSESATFSAATLRSCLKADPNHPKAYLGRDPQAFSCWGKTHRPPTPNTRFIQGIMFTLK